MIVGIHTDLNNNFCKWIKRFELILHENSIQTVRLDVNQPDFWDKIKELDYFIFRFQNLDSHHQVARSILPVIEDQLKIPVFPNRKTWWCFDDKIREWFLLNSANFPFIKSWVFFTKSEAVNWLKSAQLPIVFKLKEGAGSRDVILVKTEKQAKNLINRMFYQGMISSEIKHGKRAKQKNETLKRYFKNLAKKIIGWYRKNYDPRFWQIQKNYVYFQKFLPNNEYDTRVTVIGDKALAFRRSNRKNDFRSSGSGLIEYDQSKIDIRFIKLAFEITNHFDFQVMTYDFLLDKDNNPQICEIGYTFLDEAVYNVPGYYNKNLEFTPGHHWPQEFILHDLLNISNLKIPGKETMLFKTSNENE